MPAKTATAPAMRTAVVSVDGRAFRDGRGEHHLCAALEGEVERRDAGDGGHGGEDRAGGQPLGREVGEAEGEDRAEDDEGRFRLERHPEGPAHGEDRGERHRDGGEAVGEGGRGHRPRLGAGEVHDGPGGEEGVGLPERVGDDVERGRGEGAEAALEEHEAHLRHRRPGERHLDRALRDHGERARRRRDPAEEGEGVHGVGHREEDVGEADEEEAARVDDPGVEEGRDGGGGLHHLDEPAVGGEGRGLEERGQHDEEGGERDGGGRGGGGDGRDVAGAEGRVEGGHGARSGRPRRWR